MAECVYEQGQHFIPPKDPPSGGLPAGGTTGQALVKASDDPGDVTWATIGGGGTPIIIDTALSTTSTNPVQNKAIGQAITDINATLAEKADSAEVDAELATLSAAIALKADTADLDNYYNKTATNTLLDEKQDVLTAGQNITITKNTQTGETVISATGDVSVDWTEITNKPDNLATTDDVDAKVFVAHYGTTTAQDILAYLDSTNEPFAPMLIERNGQYYTVTTATKQGTDSVIIRSFATLSGDYYMFTYTVTNGTWTSSSHGFQKKLEAGENITLTPNPQTGLVTISASGGGSGMAALFDYATTDPIDTQGAHDIAAFMSAYLNLPGMATGVGTSNLGYKVPTMTVGDYTWTSPDAEGNQTATTDVTITFADGSTLTKTLNFKTGQSYRVYAARSTDGAYIDTGLTLNYAYTFRATGFITGASMGVFIGAFSAQATRTTARLLPTSQKIQHMWPGNTEYAASTIGGVLEFSLGEEFTVQYSAIEFHVWNESGVDYNPPVSGKTQTGTDNVPVLLFDETTGGSYKNAVIRNARIYDENGYEARNYWPMMLDNEIVYVDTAIGTEDNIIQDLIAKGPYSEYAGYVYHTPVGAFEEVNQA